ncbi:MAG: putative bifunctional diguanylate cyclase/phosphodiesterase [Actinomycetota bacterium]
MINDRRGRSDRTGRVIGVLVVPVVILAMVGMLLLLEARAASARSRYADIVLAEIRVNHLHTTILEQIARGRLPNEVSDAEVATRSSQAAASIDSLDVQSTRDDFAMYLDAANRGMALRRAGLSAMAADVGAYQLVPAFDVLQRELDTERALLEQRSDDARLWRIKGSILTLIIGGLCLALVVRSAERARRLLAAGQEHASALRESARRFDSLISESSDLVTVLDRDGRVTFQSGSIEQLLGWSVDDVLGHDIREFLDDGQADTVPSVLEEAQLRPDSRRSVAWQMRRKDGEMLRVEAVATGRFDDPDIAGCLLNIRDQSERLVLEEALRHQAFHDPLTALPNRALFEDRLAHAFDRTVRGGHSICLLMADLDDFKDINDTFGHALGDAVLVEVARRLKGIVRTDDTVARLGGDEFGILVEELDIEHDGEHVAERILEVLAEPVVVGDVEVFAHASIGIALGTASGGMRRETTSQMVEKLLIDADLAMHEAKRQGRRGFRYYASSMEKGIKERMAMRSDLERGLSRGEFVLYYQPIVSIETSAVVGAEALIRWQHPERGLVPPMEFIPLAEKTGLIVSIGHWVLEEACREAACWEVDSSSGVAPYVSVNVSSAQLQQAGFVLEVEDVLDTSGLEPARLVLEVTESALIEDSDGNVLKLAQLRDIGIRLAIDDFGTGYSSLSYLRQFNLDILKIDKSFIDVLGRDSKGSALVAAMVAMGTSLSMEVIAEGIEDHGQLQDLRTLHCNLGQGYLFARPVTAAELAVLLTTGVTPQVIAPLRLVTTAVDR